MDDAQATVSAWKQFERDAARLFGGSRYWANSGESVDFRAPGYVGQCKLVKRMSLEQISQLAEELEQAALPHQAGVLVVKCRRGRGRPSPILVICTAAVWTHLNGSAESSATAP